MPDNIAYQPRIPDAVRQASLRADELAREAGVANMDEPPPGDNPEGGSGGQPDTTVVTEPESRDPQGFEQPQAPVDETQPPAPAQADWEQRYNTLQGKYNSEIPELRGQVRSLQDTLALLRTAPPQAPFPTSTTAASVPPEDVENYGQDLITGTQRWAEARLSPRLAELERRLTSVEGGTQQIAHMSAADRVQQALSRQVPNWEALNTDDGFLTWLAQVDPFSGQSRKQMLTDAYGSGDAVRTVAFFQAYQNEHTVARQSAGILPVQTEAQASADRLPLANLTVPGRGTTATPQAPGAPDRRIWTANEITQFYRQKREGRWQGREAEAERIDNDIIAAGREGRVRQQ
jgi:hypothetical protein